MYLLISYSHLNVVVSVVVEVEDPVELGVQGDPQVVRVLDALAQRLPGVLLHLDVVELPANTKLLDTRIYDYLYRRLILVTRIVVQDQTKTSPNDWLFQIIPIKIQPKKKVVKSESDYAFGRKQRRARQQF